MGRLPGPSVCCHCGEPILPTGGMKILAALSEAKQALTYDVIAEKTGLARGTVRHLVNRTLTNHLRWGKVTRFGERTVALSAEGKRAVSHILREE